MAQVAVFKAQNRASSKGCDPRLATCRGKLQNQRSLLNEEINKGLRIRAGAENLYKAITNSKLKKTVELELSFVNSNLQLLKEQLSELNSSVELYQGECVEAVIPMIPLGLKETKEIDFMDPFKDFILEHYSEDGNCYEGAIKQFMELREAMRTPCRDESGISLLFSYCNQLYFIDRRFCPSDRSLGIYFEWYDSLTGVPSSQRTVAFEKACVLFNMAAIYTQIAAYQDRLTSKGLDLAVDSFLRAAGTFTYIREHFTNSPSLDLTPPIVEMLIQLMKAQARECLFEKLELQSRNKRDIGISFDLAQEAAQVSEVYKEVFNIIGQLEFQEYVPYSWTSLIQLKRVYYLAISHYHCSLGLLTHSAQLTSNRNTQMIKQIHSAPLTNEFSKPLTASQRRYMGRAHLKSAIQYHEETEHVYNMCRDLKNKSYLYRVLANSFERTMEAYKSTEEKGGSDFSDVLEFPDINPSSKFELNLTPPDFSHLPVEDLFRDLGPVAIFSAKHCWTAPRSIELTKSQGHNDQVEFGFSVRGDAPVIVAIVDQGSLAHKAGMKEGDFIVSINGIDVKWALHDTVVKMIKECSDYIRLKLVTPTDRNYLQPRKKTDVRNPLDCEIASKKTDNNESSNSSMTQKKILWNPFKKNR